MKIGIVTIYHANVGSLLQASSLLKELEGLGHTCEIINASVRGRYMWRYYLATLGSRIFPKCILKSIEKKIPAFAINNSILNDIQKLPLSPFTLGLSKIEKRYDCFVLGSDEIWSADLRTVKFVPAYFGIGTKKPIISYASSAVSLQQPKEEVWNKMCNAWKNIRSIAVRDETTREIIYKVMPEKEIQIVLDPTLLNPYFVPEHKERKNYIVVYGTKFTEQQVEIIKKYAYKNDWSLRAVSWPHEWCDEFIKTEGAEEMQRIFAESSYAVVSTFHGTIFAILNHVPFTSFAADFRQNKIIELLDILGMKDRLYDGEEKFEFNLDINWEWVEDRISEMRIVSEQYLRGALKQIEKGIQ